MDIRDTILEQQAAQITELTNTIRSQSEAITELQSTIAELNERIRELQEQLGRNSKNSSKPPSSDPFGKESKGNRTPSGRKPGGQKGHKGSHMIVPHEPDAVEPHHPSKCMACPHFAECISDGSVFSCGESRYVVDTVVKTVVTEHQIMVTSCCPQGESELRGSFPENIKAYVQYGDTVTALVGLMSTYGAVSVNRIRTIVNGLLGVRLSTGVIPSMAARCAATVGPTLEKIREILSGGSLGHFDETGAYVGGGLMWVHNSSNAEYTYQTVSTRRGRQGMDENGVLPSF